ncbi:hypothetical protein BU16DRAFT_543429 [Lophium mytilinum]|uniref:Uncharacterized protein n=1 Tax=Lophium mytilinum TaxID=390894 RepID=A0A6A6QGL1_9PEZI|nr:hypothetical protein BU16DRAFT_543429 [Lophium mytilinum]
MSNYPGLLATPDGQALSEQQLAVLLATPEAKECDAIDVGFMANDPQTADDYLALLAELGSTRTYEVAIRVSYRPSDRLSAVYLLPQAANIAARCQQISTNLRRLNVTLVAYVGDRNDIACAVYERLDDGSWEKLPGSQKLSSLPVSPAAQEYTARREGLQVSTAHEENVSSPEDELSPKSPATPQPPPRDSPLKKPPTETMMMPAQLYVTPSPSPVSMPPPTAMNRESWLLSVEKRIKTLQQVILGELRSYIASGALADRTTLLLRVTLGPGEDNWQHLSPSYLEPFKASRLHHLKRLEMVVELSPEVVQEVRIFPLISPRLKLTPISQRAAQGFVDAVAYSLEQPVVDRYREWCLPALSELVVDFGGAGLTPMHYEFYLAEPEVPSTTGRTRGLFRH